MLLKKFKIILCILLICLVFTGCNSSQSLSDLTIVQGVGVDLQDDDTKVSLQYLNLAQGGVSSDSLVGNITTVADGSGKNISDAISSSSKTLSKEVFFGQNKLIVFGSDYVKNSIGKGIDYLLRSVDSRPDVVVAISDTTAEDIIKNKERDSKVPAETVYKLLAVGEENGLGAVVTVNELLDLYSDKTSDIYLPVVKSEDDNVVCEGIAIFSNDKYITTLDENQTFGFLFINNKIEGGAISVKSSELGNIGIEVINSKTKNHVTISNDKITFNCKIKVNFMLDEIENGITTAVDEKKIKSIESLVEKKVQSMCNSAFNACISNKSDAFMIGRYLAKTDEDYYNSIKNNWQNALQNVDFNITVDCKLEKVNDNSIRE
jgi:spore germination protein KC